MAEGEREVKRMKIDHTADTPTALNVSRLVVSHAKEIRALTQTVNKVRHRKGTQDVPHYMRRRAASHNINRVPRRVREKMGKIKVPPKPKKASRHHKRRPKNLNAEYTRRQRRVRWLETHIWHAKRFHMLEMWGYKLPDYPTAKGERASCIAATKHCLIQDQSYLHCMEISAPKHIMIEKLRALIPCQQLEKDTIESYINGCQSVRCTLYETDKYPAGAVAPVEIMFNPRPDQESHHQIWLWCHVAAYTAVWSVILKTFQATQAELNEDDDSEESPISYPVYTSDDKSITVISLIDSLIRFKLNGKKTLETLDRVIQIVETNPDAEGAHVWWKADLSSSASEIASSSNLTRSYDKWTGTPNEILTLRARDPRLCMTKIQQDMTKVRKKKEELIKKQEKQGTNFGMNYNLTYGQADEMETEDHMDSQEMSDNEAGGLTAVSEETAADVTDKAELSSSSRKRGFDLRNRIQKSRTPPLSPLWNESLRNTVSKQMMTQHEINQRRSQLLIPGSELSLGDEENCVPLMIVLNDKSADLIMPASWGLAFWMAFQYAGARAGGLRESRLVNFQTQLPHFPDDIPDSALCNAEELNKAKELTTKHHKYPPSKRPNYDKLNTYSPFRFDWKNVIEGSDPQVVRDLALLDSLRVYIGTKSEDESRSLETSTIKSAGNLIQVKVTMINRGVPEERAEICLPTADDITKLQSGENKYGLMMPLCKTETKSRDDTHTVADKDDKHKTHRTVIGYVKYGRYIQDSGSARGQGFVSADMLVSQAGDGDMRYSLGDTTGVLCLVRPVDQTQYRWAVLDVY